MQELESQLREDLNKIGLCVDCSFILKGYSKSYYGRYDPNRNAIILYTDKNLQGAKYSYAELLMTTIHEAVHCKQWSDPNFKRVKGIMHNPDFLRMYNAYSNKAKARLYFKELVSYAKSN